MNVKKYDIYGNFMRMVVGNIAAVEKKKFSDASVCVYITVKYVFS